MEEFNTSLKKANTFQKMYGCAGLTVHWFHAIFIKYFKMFKENVTHLLKPGRRKGVCIVCRNGLIFLLL